MKNTVKDLIIIIMGWFFIVLGIAGLFLPVLQGVLFLMIGLYLLSQKAPWARRYLERFYSRYPGLAVPMRKARARINRFIRNIGRRK